MNLHHLLTGTSLNNWEDGKTKLNNKSVLLEKGNVI